MASPISGGGMPAADVVDAGFWKRLAAFTIDGVLLLVATSAIIALLLIVVGAGEGGLVAMFEASANGQMPSRAMLVALVLGFYVVPFLLRWAYFSLFTASSWQGTPGKRAVGIKVVDRWAHTDHPERQQRGLGGRAIAALLGFGLFVLLAIAGVIVAISLPTFPQHTPQATVDQLIDEGERMTVGIEDFVQNTDRCPATLDEAGLAAPADPLVDSVDVGELDAGRCTLRFTLGNAGEGGALAGEFLWFVRENDGSWTCGGSMDAALLSAHCPV